MVERVRPMTEADLDQVLAWRNHLQVRRFMYTQHEISSDEHRHWYAKASTDENRHLLIYEDRGVAQGFVAFTRTSAGSPVADWGFYLAPDAARGTGGRLGRAALDHAFAELALHKVNGQALGYNERSIRFHERLGFNREGCLRQQYFDGQTFHDVILFGLLASEWESGGDA